MPDDLARAAELSRSMSEAVMTVSTSGSLHADPSVPGAMLRALATMARASKRHQAELGVALARAGLSLSADAQAAALRHLCDVNSITDVIVLEDGGTLLSVTSAGMERAYR